MRHAVDGTTYICGQVRTADDQGLPVRLAIDAHYARMLGALVTCPECCEAVRARVLDEQRERQASGVTVWS